VRPGTGRTALALVLVLSLAAGCLPAPAPASGWSYADLRAVSWAALEGEGPALSAIYLRQRGSELHIRLDLLDSQPRVDYDLYLAIDVQPGGMRQLPLQAEADLEWDYLVVLPADGANRVENAQGEMQSGMKMRVLRDSLLDTIEINLDRAALGTRASGLRVQAFIAAAGAEQAADAIGPAAADRWRSPPPERARVLLAFWNTFPAATPAQALRRWDGAHSGPDSSRHGLRRLLQAVEASRQPVVLLDLLTPQALSALDFSGDVEMLARLSRRGLVLLPEVGLPNSQPGSLPFQPPDWVLAEFAVRSREAGRVFGLAAGGFRYTKNEGSGAAGLDGGRAFIPLPVGVEDSLASSPWQALEDGPSAEVRAALRAASRPASAAEGRAAPLVLGGSLPDTSWGELTSARNTLRWLAARPWIEVVGPGTLRHEAGAFADLPAAALPGALAGEEVEALHQEVLAALRSAPPGRPLELAWQAYDALLAPNLPGSAELPRLRQAYLGQIGYLLEAARWAEDPAAYGETSRCDQDLDWDGQAECILAADWFFGVFHRQGGYLSTAFVYQQGQAHQVIAPSSQFVVGLGDPSTWDIERGIAGDPAQLRGAFTEVEVGQLSPSWEEYGVEIFPGGLTFRSPGGLEKTFRLEEDRLRAEYRTSSPLRVEIPLALVPQARFTPGWAEAYIGKIVEGGWRWGLSGGAQVTISTDGRMQVRAFNEAGSARRQPEDPNFAYPPGHFLPFPMAAAQVEGVGEFVIELVVGSR
jgi:hypothetical protein